jgi:PAS domain S-box-containing protein/putative nucleotidyltransferase with HDIG domain
MKAEQQTNVRPSGTTAAMAELSRMGDNLIRPHPDIVPADHRRRARMLSSVLLVFVAAAAAGTLLSIAYQRSPVAGWVPAGGFCLFAGAYGLSRTRHYPLAALAALTTLVVAVVLTAIGMHEPDALYFLAFTILLGTLLLPPLATALLAAGIVAIVLSLPATTMTIGLDENLAISFLLGMTGMIATVVAAQQQRDMQKIDAQALALRADNLKLQTTQQSLSTSRAQLANILENAAEAIIALDVDQRIILFNSGAERVFGYTPDEANGQPLSLLLPKPVAGIHQQQVQTFGAERQSARAMAHRAEVTGRRKDGTEFPAEVGISSYGESRQTVYTAVLVDITQRKQHERELEVVAAVSSALRKAQNSASMLPIILDQLSAVLPAAGSGIALRQDAGGGSLIELGRGSWAAPAGEQRASARSLSALVVNTGRAYWNNQAQAAAPLARPALPDGIQAVAGVPLIVQDQALGALWIGKDTPITHGELNLLTAIADIAANAIHRSTLHEQTERQLNRLTVLRAMELAASSSLDLKLVLEVLLEQITTRLAIDAADVLLVQPSQTTLEYAAGRGFRLSGVTQRHMALGEGLAGTVALRRQVVYVSNLDDVRPTLSGTAWMDGEDFVSYYAAPLIVAGQIVGVLEVFQRSHLGPDLEWSDFFEGLALQAAIAIEKAQLYDRLRLSTQQLALAYDATIEGWSRALDLRDHETEGHSVRVTELSLQLARALGIDEEQIVHIRRGALLHDIGKMGIPDQILLKAGPLTPEEREIICEHPANAYQLLSPIAYLTPALDIPYCHHEKWDGTGYPRGLAGQDIPLAARIFAVVDVWDALCSDRPYRRGWPPAKVREYIRDQAGKHFDPQIVDVFLGQNIANWNRPAPARLAANFQR